MPGIQPQEMVRDRNWVSRRALQDLPGFGKVMIERFAEYQQHPQPQLQRV